MDFRIGWSLTSDSEVRLQTSVGDFGHLHQDQMLHLNEAPPHAPFRSGARLPFEHVDSTPHLIGD